MTTTEQTGDTQVDEAAVGDFLEKLVGDLAGSMATRFAIIGDALGLWKALATGPATSDELAGRTELDERYVREWLAGVHAAGYVEHDPATATFTLPAHAFPALVDEGGTMFVGGDLQLLRGIGDVQNEVIEAFRTGGGVPQSHMSHDVFAGIARATNIAFDHLLVQDWLPRLPEVEAALERGCEVADVGTGAARALVTLAQRYPNSRYVGFEVSSAQLDLAEAAISEAGVGDRVRVELLDGSEGLPGEYDLITTFDVIHDAADPAGLLRSIRDALRVDGRYLCLDMNASHELEENVGPVHTLFYGYSIHYCMTTSLANGGAGLGTCGFNPHVAEQMCKEAGFGGFRLIDIENPFNHLYEATP